MKTIIESLIAYSVPVSIMGMAAFLIYKQSTGWGWFLFVALLIVGNMEIRVD